MAVEACRRAEPPLEGGPAQSSACIRREDVKRQPAHAGTVAGAAGSAD
jgi:hypothetical protein